MPGTVGPNLGLTWGYSPHESGWGVESYNPGFAMLDTLLQLFVIDTLNTPPGTPANGDKYIVGGSPTGVFVGHSNHIAVYLDFDTAGWRFFTPKPGWKLVNYADGLTYIYSGSAWVEDNPVFIGDTGSGGAIGLVPAPAAGDAAAGKFLKADGSFAVPPGSGGSGLYAPELSAIPTAASTGLGTWINQGTATVADSPVGVCITDPTGGSFRVRGRSKTAPATPYLIKALVSMACMATGAWVGLGWYDGTKLHLFGPNLNATGGFSLLSGKLNTVTSYNANDLASVNGIPPLVWLQIGDDGTNITFSYSLDGYNFTTFQTLLRSTAWLGASGYTNVLFFFVPPSGGQASVLSWS